MLTGGWNKEKVQIFEQEFLNFLQYVQVNSKDLGKIILGEHVYRAQQRLLDGIFSGLSQDKHDFKVLKSRQLGISTLSRALTLFWIGIHDGLNGFMVFDTDGNKERARTELTVMLENLPKSLHFPGIVVNNRTMLQLENDSICNFASAGVRAGKTSGVLGRSAGVNFVHASEMCSWDNTEGLTAFENSLSDQYPDRLYLWESTARGYNQWHKMWREAKADTSHQVPIFIGWWAKDTQFISREHPDFLRYGMQPPSDKELQKIREVRDRYGWEVTAEQLAWIRWKMDPLAEPDGDADAEFEGDVLEIQEQPWTEEEAFQVTGATFFDPGSLTDQENNHVSNKFKTYSYGTGIEFAESSIYPAPNARSVQLKVWEEPENDAVYVIAADPAFGANENNDRSAIQVLRCYADGMDQVAEYAWPLVNTRQFAWVIASLLGHYSTVGGNGKATVYFILEINGPGEAVMNELRSLKHQIQVGYQPKPIDEKGLRNIFFNVREYIYNRSDSMGAGHNWHFKTTAQLKVAVMERLRDFTANGMLRLRSHDTIEEMKTIQREGDSIEASQNNKDDRVISLALGVRCWEERARKEMVTFRRTRAQEEAKKRLTIKDQITMFNQTQLDSFFKAKAGARQAQLAMMRRAQWRGRR